MKPPFLYFLLHKSYIWRPLGHVMDIFSYCHFHNASKECFRAKNSNFMHGFKSAILAIFQFCQSGTFEPVLDTWNFFWSKAFFWYIMKMAIRKNIHNMHQGPPNPGFRSVKVQNDTFFKKDSRELFFFSCFRFLLISRRPGTLNWERVVFLPSKNLCRKCVVILL